MNLGQQVVIVVSVALVTWYAAFFFVNRRRGIALYHWLRKGAEEGLGALSEAGWVGSAANGGRLVVGKAAPPFQRVELVFLLQSREILPLWAFNLARGKRDELILKAVLRSAPRRQVEAFPAGAPLPDGYLEAGQAGGLTVAVRGRNEAEAVVGKALRVFLERYGAHIRLFSLQRARPHLIIRLGLESGLDAAPSAEFFRDLQRAFS